MINIIKSIKYIIVFIILILINTSSSQSQVLPGIDVLLRNDYYNLKGKQLILFTNSTGRSSDGRLTAEILANSTEIKLLSILTPEHGFFAAVPAGVKVDNDNIFDVPVHSLYSNIKKPGSTILENCDAIIVDIQDIGVRSYTYISSLYRIMQAAYENNKTIYVLDRPNPLGGSNVDGNVLEKGMQSFVGIAPIAYIHGLTIGELALMFNEEGWLNEGNQNNVKCDLKIIRMENYKRSMIWEDTGLMWFPTSPNVPTVNSARGLSVLGIFGELGFISIGIGTTTPFQLLGSPEFVWKDVKKYYNNIYGDGISFSEARYNPQFAMYNGKNVNGIFLNFKKSDNFRPYIAGLELMLAIRTTYPALFNSKNIKENSKAMFSKVTGTQNIFNALFNNLSEDEIFEYAKHGLDEFLELRSKYLLYD